MASKKTTPLPRKPQPHRQPQLKLHSCMQVNWISTLSEIKFKKELHLSHKSSLIDLFIAHTTKKTTKKPNQYASGK